MRTFDCWTSNTAITSEQYASISQRNFTVSFVERAGMSFTTFNKYNCACFVAQKEYMLK